ncbi:ATP-binding cassette domain-containing protein, partial [Klebsiella pneumoniae]|nr:ATP-binding cassette domain-containing protein [Klebsiella pneumoniae]
MLELHDVHAHYGSSHVLHGVSLNVSAGEAVALMGRNGVGKTTTIRTIMGFLPASGGSITFQDASIQDEPPHRRARQGIS